MPCCPGPVLVRSQTGVKEGPRPEPFVGFHGNSKAERALAYLSNVGGLWLEGVGVEELRRRWFSRWALDHRNQLGFNPVN